MSGIRNIDKSIRMLDKILEYFAMTTIIISVILAFLNVILRYLFGISYEILSEISTYSIVYGVFAYLGPLIKQNEHIKMNVLYEVIRGRLINYIDLIISILLVFTFLFLLYAGLNWVSSLLEMQTKTLSGGMLLFIPAMAIVIGMLLGLIYSLLELTKDINKLSNK